jgi:hypothetical protein
MLSGLSDMLGGSEESGEAGASGSEEGGMLSGLSDMFNIS